MSEDFFHYYLKYTSGGETPPTFHRWSAIAGIAALLERSIHTPFGNNDLHPNIYTMLIGTAGTRKSTAIKLMKKLLIQTGYNTIAAERTSKEKYFADLASQSDIDSDDDSILEKNLFGESGGREYEVTPNLIAADEANDFFGQNNIDFLSVLGSLWDWEGKYENRVKTGKSDFIPNPTITILSGNTPTGFATAFPPNIFGQGFFSRLLLIYSEPTGQRIAFPKTPAKEETLEIVKLLQQIKLVGIGQRLPTQKATEFLEHIYAKHIIVDDPRFDSYSNRRSAHLLKLCLIVSAARFETEITEHCVLQANTYLTYVESLMPKALGEFGRARDADTTHLVVTAIEGAIAPMTLKELWIRVKNNLDKPGDLSQIIQKLLFADQIQTVHAGSVIGFLPKKKELVNDPEKLGLVSYSDFLTPFELGVTR